MSSRYTHIDIAKGIGILFVVLGHNPLVRPHGTLFDIIFSFHMPLFFFLSGLFMTYQIDLPRVTTRKFDSYLKPYFSLFFLIGIFLIPSENISSLEYFAAVMYGTGESVPREWSPLWFLPHLWAVSLFSYLCYTRLNLGAKGALVKAFSLALILSLGWLGMHSSSCIPLSGTHGLPLGLPFSLDLLLVSSSYFLLGGFLKQYTLKLNFHWPVFILAASSFAFFHLRYDCSMDLNMRRYDHLGLSTVEALLGIYLVISVSIALRSRPLISKALSYIGTATLFILIFHLYIQKRLFSILTGSIGNRFFLNALLSFMLAISAPLLLHAFAKRNSILEGVFLPIRSGTPGDRLYSVKKSA